MAAEREQNTWLERLLRRPSAGSAAATPPSGVCLDAETLAAWADGALDAKELAAAEIHASACTSCTALLAAIERAAPVVSVESRSRGALFRWLVPLAAAATAVAIWIAIPGQRVTPVAREEAASPSVTAPPPAEVAPPLAAPQSAVPPPVATPEPKSELQRQRSARLDDLSTQAQEIAQEPLKEGNAAVGAAADRVAPAPAAPAPAAAASADAFGQKAAAPAERRALNETVVVVIEGVSPNDPLIRWRFLSDIERSTDGGQTWTKAASNPPGSVVSIRVVDALNATVTTSEGRTLSTTDGGATWAPVQEKPAAPF